MVAEIQNGDTPKFSLLDRLRLSWKLAKDVGANLPRANFAVKMLLDFHENLEKLDANLHSTVSELPDEDWEKANNHLSEAYTLVLESETELIEFCRKLTAMGLKIRDLDQLEKKHDDLKAALEKEWDYGNDAFLGIVKRAKAEIEAGHLEEWP